MNTVKFKRKKSSYHAPMSGVCYALQNIQLKIDAAAGFVYVDQESFERYRPSSFSQLLDGFREFKEACVEVHV